MKLYLNSSVYPYNDWNLNFENNQYVLAYHYFTDFVKTYYGKDREVYISPNEWKENAPLFVFNCQFQEEVIKTGSINLRLEFESSKNFEEDTICNIAIIHDRVVNYCPLDGTVNLIV